MARFDEGIFRYLVARGRLAWQLATTAPAARRVRRPEHSWEEIIEYVAQFVGGYMRPAQVRSEIKAALESVEEVQPKTLLEIGTAFGGTFLLLARAASAQALLVSLDLPQGPWGGGYSWWKTHVFRRLILKGQSAQFIRADSHSLASLLKVRQILRGAPLDVLFIDGDHSYEGVKQDFDMYSPLVRPGGLVLFHDIAEHSPELGCDVAKFWGEVRQKYASEAFIEDQNQGWAGIGLLRKPSR